ncbi:MAG: RNA polymerase sigma factor [Firmicutes bacterium HGW-Firmicutes-21]|nr:MAG: RNA polymerase sigma factor [Firmicutes bacterium HGW-Firmicutes-21]
MERETVSIEPSNELFRQRVQSFGDTVFKVAFNRLQNFSDAEDITQEVFIALYTTKSVFESDEHLKAWLIRVAINKCKDLRKSFWNTRTESLTDQVAYSLDQTDNTVLSELKKLSPVYRDSIYLYYYEGYKINEIAEITGVSINTASSRLKRARKKLGLILEGAKAI